MAVAFLIVSLIAGIISIGMAMYFRQLVLKEDPGNEKMVTVAGYIEDGAKAYIKVQYMVLGIFVGALFFVILFLLPSPLAPGERYAVWFNWEQALAYLIGSAGSMVAGYLGLYVGVKANTRAAQACTIGTKEGFNVAFFGGSVMGLAVVGVALIGVS
ncbi:MAG: sodium/proton-translocating pyrophosphatase, partial [Candidatus Lokiarchaeota archaeon]|nr:sodium/proton-translocating pyrophosphatase [Candidatus Lokiarchaeota archaeon]